MNNKTIILVTVCIFVAIGVLIFWLTNRNNCDNRNTDMPTFPVHSDSSLVREFEYLNTTHGTILEFTYLSSTPLEDVEEFYEEYTTCSLNRRNGLLNCEGNSEPFGTFTVYLDGIQGNHEYRITLAWDKCNSEWEEINSVE